MKVMGGKGSDELKRVYRKKRGERASASVHGYRY